MNYYLKRHGCNMLYVICECVFSLQSCKESEIEQSIKTNSETSQSLKSSTNPASLKEKQTAEEVFFAKVLAKTVKQDKDVRQFLKSEALKMFDKLILGRFLY